jgi:hypothetical protein
MIEIKTEKVIKHDEPMYKVLDIKALNEYQVPEEYINTIPHCYYFEANNIISPCLLIRVEDETYQKIREMAGGSVERMANSTIPMGILSQNRAMIVIGRCYCKDIFEETIKVVEQCGENLKKINDKKRLEKDWHGEKVWEI